MRKEINRLIIFSFFLSLLISVTTTFAEIIPDIHEINNLRHTKTLHVIIKQSYSDYEFKDMYLPFEGMARKIFSYVGVNIKNNNGRDNDIILKINAKGKSQAISFNFDEEYNTVVYLSGIISLEIREVPIIQKKFDVYITSDGVNDTQNPYVTAFYMKDSVIPKLFEVIYEVYGINSLITILNDENPDIQSRVEETIIKIGKPAVEFLITALKYDELNIRKEAIKILGGIKDSRAVKPLIDALKDENSKIQWWAAKALGEIKDKSAVDALIEALKDEDANVRWRVAKSLGEIKDSRAVEPLVVALKDENSGVRCIVIEALKDITGRDFIDEQQKKQVYLEKDKIKP